MKKILVLILVLSLTLSVVISASAGGCSLHGYNSTVDVGTATYTYSSQSDRTHLKTKQQKVMCTLCGQDWSESSSVSENHTLSLRDMGHNSTTSKHTWLTYCTVCNYSKSTVYSCNGNPCVNPQCVPVVPVPELY